eukprot:4232085-Prymnesium_polylepis.1
MAHAWSPTALDAIKVCQCVVVALHRQRRVGCDDEGAALGGRVREAHPARLQLVAILLRPH